MLIIYDSLTRNVERFISKIKDEQNEYVKISKGMEVNQPFVLITYTTGMGVVPGPTKRFLKENSEHMLAVMTSGNRNWGLNYGKAGDTISSEYNVPLLMKFELSGKVSDVQKAKELIFHISDNSLQNA